MFRFLLIFILFIPTTICAETPLQVVRRVRAKYPNLPGNRPITNQALREIAADPAVKGGIYKKTTGNNCLGYSCDIICYKDNRLFDVFVAWDTQATAAWNLASTNGDASRCELMNVVTPPPNPCPTCPACPVCPTCPPVNNCTFEKAEVIRLSQALAELTEKYNNVRCTTPSYFGWHSPCTVIK